MTDHDDIHRPPVDTGPDDASIDDAIDDRAVDAAELTIDADPVWLEEIRAVAGDGTADESGDESGDPELTVDASPELVDVIRSEIARRDAAVGGVAMPPHHPIAPSPPSTTSPITKPQVPPVATQPRPDGSAGPAGRWQPQQRLASRAPVIATTPIVRTDHRHRTKDSTKIILAAIAATAVVAVAWLLVGGETADAPPAIDPSVTVDTVATGESVQPATDSTSPGSTPP